MNVVRLRLQQAKGDVFQSKTHLSGANCQVFFFLAHSYRLNGVTVQYRNKSLPALDVEEVQF